MKRLLLVLFMMFAVSAIAMAGNPATGNITITCNAAMSVAVSTSNNSGDWNDPASTMTFGGLVWTQYTCIAAQPFYIWNTSPSTGSCVQKYSLQTNANTNSAGTYWSASSGTWTVGIDNFAIGAVFAPVGSGLTTTDFTGSNTNALPTGGGVWWDPTHFNVAKSSYSAAQSYNPTSTPTNVLLWPCIKTPAAISGQQQQTIIITVTAGMSGT